MIRKWNNSWGLVQGGVTTQKCVESKVKPKCVCWRLIIHYNCAIYPMIVSNPLARNGGGGGSFSCCVQGRIQFIWGGQKIMCAYAHHEREARNPLRPGSMGSEALGGGYALSCYLSLILSILIQILGGVRLLRPLEFHHRCVLFITLIEERKKHWKWLWIFYIHIYISKTFVNEEIIGWTKQWVYTQR